MFAVAHVVHQFADDDDPGIRLERRQALGTVGPGGFNQADRGHLFQVGRIAAGPAKLARASLAQIHVRGDDGVTIGARAMGEITVDDGLALVHCATLPMSE